MNSGLNPGNTLKNFQRILKNESPIIFGDGMQALDYIYVDDVVDAIIRSMEMQISGEVLNVCSGKAVKIRDLTGQMLEVAGANLEPEHQAADWTSGSYREGDNEKIRRCLGW